MTTVPSLARHARLSLLTLAASVALAGAAAAQSGAVTEEARTAGTGSETPAALLRAARSWGYQLQSVAADTLDKTTFDVLVVDAGHGDGRDGLTKRDVARLKTKPDGSRRVVLAYVNIGEAEDYRYYWQPAWAKRPPDWMGSANCRWKGDHRVRHWHADWQRIVFGTPKSYVGRLIEAGYDGAWLDRVDIFYYWRTERWQAADDMVQLVTGLSAWAKARRPGFLIVPQNGEELLSDARYRRAIDGMGKEDMLYGDLGNDVRNHEARIARAERNFAPARADGLPVLAVEYTRDPANVATARRELEKLGFTSYFGPRSLAYIGQDGPAHAEDGDTEPTVANQTDESCE